MGVEVNTARVWSRAEELELSRVVFVNMLDRERADFYRSWRPAGAALASCVAIELPIGTEHELTGIVDLLHNCAYMDPGGSREGDPVPCRRDGRHRRRVPREAARRGRRDRRRADGVLPRRRGARPDRGRGGAEERGHQGPALPGRLRGGDEEPRHPCAPRPARGGHPVARAQGRRRRHTGRHRRVRLQDGGRPVRGQDQRLPRVRGHGRRRLDARQPARQGQGAARRADDAAREGAREGRRVRRRRHRRGREAEGRPDRRPARRLRARDRGAPARRSPSR